MYANAPFASVQGGQSFAQKSNIFSRIFKHFVQTQAFRCLAHGLLRYFTM